MIATPFATFGYLRDGRVSPEGFAPVGGEGGPTVAGFATGDRGSIDEEGLLRYHGRLDHMLKVRGNRVELLEVEAALRAAGVETASIAAEEAADGDHQLHCFYVSPGADAGVEERLRAHVRDALPAYMHPASYTAVPTLPTTTSGKLDRRALLGRRAAPAATEGGAPAPAADPVEAQLAADWAQVLGVPGVPLDTPFHALGGSSLRAMQLIARVFKRHRVALNVREVLGGESVRSLAARIRGGTGAPAPATAPPREPRAGGDAPLSPYQRMMWDLAQHPPAVPAYHEFVAVELPAAPDPAVCRRVMEALVERHEILRTAFVEHEGAPLQRVLPPAQVPLELGQVDLRGEADPDAAWRAHFLDDAERPFDLARPPLFRARVYRLAEERCVLAVVLYHISVDVAAREARELYAGLAAGRAPSLPPLDGQYRDFAVRSVRETAAARDRGRAFWAGYLPSPLPELKLSPRRPFLKSFAGDTRGFGVAPDAVARLRAAAAAAGVTPFVVGLSAYARALADAADEGRLVVGCAVSLRDQPHLDGQLGLYLNVVPVALDLSAAGDAAGWVRHVAERVARAMAFKEYPVHWIGEDLRLPLRPSRAALYDTTFTLAERDPGAGPPLVALPRRHSKFDLSLTLAMMGDEVSGVAEFNPGIVDGAAVEARMQAYLGGLDALCADLLAAAPPAAGAGA